MRAFDLYLGGKDFNPWSIVRKPNNPVSVVFIAISDTDSLPLASHDG